MEAHIYLEAEIPMVGSATDFTYKWCVNMGLQPDEAARMALAADEILTDIVLYAYPEEAGYIEIWYQYSFSEIEIIIQENGEPFDPGKYLYSLEKAMNENNFDGASQEIVRKMTDQFLFLNRGKDGKEFRLMKRFVSDDIRKTVVKGNEIADADHPGNVANQYLITPFTSEDAEDIAKLIYRSYSYTYSKEELYFPKRIEMAIRHNYKFGTIVRTESDVPAGYFAVLMSTDSLIGEVGEAVVSPTHRNRGLMKRMMNKLIEMSRERGLLGLFGEAVTVHTFSQKVNETYGFKSTALVITSSQKRVFKGLKTEPSDIMSVVVEFLPLSSRRRKPVILPDTYSDLLTEIYRQFRTVPAETSEANTSQKEHEGTNLDLNINYEKESALIIVRDVGTAFEASCNRMLRSIEDVKLLAVYIDLPLNQPRTDSAIQWLKEKEFILAGLMPLFHKETDYLRMQKIRVPVDFSLIQTHSDIAGKIKDRIQLEYNALHKEKGEA